MNKGQRIRELRESKGLSQAELGKLIGTTMQNIYKYEKGIVSNIPSDKIEAMARIFNVTPAYILCWDSNEEVYSLTRKEKTLIRKYRQHPELQNAVDILLGVDGND